MKANILAEMLGFLTFMFYIIEHQFLTSVMFYSYLLVIIDIFYFYVSK